MTAARPHDDTDRCESCGRPYPWQLLANGVCARCARQADLDDAEQFDRERGDA